MSSYTGISPKNPGRYTGPNVYYPSVVARSRQPTGADYRQPETGKLYPTGSFWLISPNPTTGVQGELWYLSKIVANVAYWVRLGTSPSGPVLGVVVDVATLTGTNPLYPDPVTGLIGITGGQIAAGSTASVIRTNTFAPSVFSIEIQRSAATASSTIGSNGVSHFNSSHFTVDANGYVSLTGGGAAIDQIAVQATSGTGTNPVLPNALGQIGISAVIVSQLAVPAITRSTLPNTFITEIQTTTSSATSALVLNGLSHFSSMDFDVDANGFVQTKNSAAAIGVKNIGFSYNAGTGTFTVAGQDGTALSASNPGFVTLQSRSAPGELVTISATFNQDFIDDNGASEIINNLFGLSSGVATSVDIPFYLYAVSNDAENVIAFMISRFPNATTSPVSGKIGTPASAVASTQGSFFSFESITTTNFDQNPCLCIGSFRMRMSAANDWTVQTLAARDGIGHYQEGLQFAFPRGQFGAAAAKVFKDNGGTAPDDADGGYTYYIDQQNNRIYYQLAFPAIDTAGVGAVTAILALPFTRLEGATSSSGYTTAGGGYTILIGATAPGTGNLSFGAVNDTATGLATNASFGAGLAIALNGTMAVEFV